MGTSAPTLRDGPLAVYIDQDASALVARVFGELDIGTAEFLDQELRRISSLNSPLIILDLSSVGFIDSKGIQVLLAATRRSRENGNRLRIRRGSEVVDRVIKLSGIENSLPLVD